MSKQWNARPAKSRRGVRKATCRNCGNQSEHVFFWNKCFPWHQLVLGFNDFWVYGKLKLSLIMNETNYRCSCAPLWMLWGWTSVAEETFLTKTVTANRQIWLHGSFWTRAEPHRSWGATAKTHFSHRDRKWVWLARVIGSGPWITLSNGWGRLGMLRP